MPRRQLSLRSLLVTVAAVGFGLSYVSNFYRMRSAEAELTRLRDEVGYLNGGGANEIAAVRLDSDVPLVWQTRVRVPQGKPYRVAYGALWQEARQKPQWYAAQPVPAGESLVTIQVLKDPRDERWKIVASVRHEGGLGRIGTTLPEEIAEKLRTPHDVVSSGVGRRTETRADGDSLRLLDERFFSGRSLAFYGDQPPKEDLVGVFAELQPDVGPL